MELSDKAEEALARLEDIRVQEVSLVDRAANKRKFLVVKSSGINKTLTDKTDHVLQPEDSMANKTKDEPNTEGAAAAAKTDANEPAATPAAADSAPAAATPDPPAAPAADPPATDSAPAADPPDDKTAQPAATEPDKTPAAEPSSDNSDAQMTKAAEAVGALVGVLKVGGALSQHRMEKLRKVFDMLSGLLKDLDPDAHARWLAHGAAAAAHGVGAAAAPRPGGMMMSEDGAVDKSADKPAIPADLQATIDALKSEIDTLKSEGEATKNTVKKQAALLHKAGLQVQGSNAIDVEPSQDKRNDVFWPHDMNAKAAQPQSRRF